MLSFQLDGFRFQVRAAAVFIDEGHVLAHRAPADDYWSLPGGRVEAGEDAASTLRREMVEEIGQEIVCHRLVYLTEAFFEIAAQPNHEIGLYFLASLPAASGLLDKTRSHVGIEGGVSLEFRWWPIEGLRGIDLRPNFLREALRSIPDGMQHVVHRE